ncbi:hypothetical protein [Nocardiopsis baichengensis]|uniref:hypothetical protein n=1 Tax=Nocardiopsis baichengensis TaxID=280240 RepID=UPI00034D45CE|nr:hypothetical protein [Nocardiopsis baichengensis]
MADADDELRRRLTGAGASHSGGAGPAGEQTMLALSMVSGDVRELQLRLDRLAEQVEQGDARTAEGARERLQQETEALRAELVAVAQTVTELGETVEALGAEEEEKEKPPRPWDWEAMDWRQEVEAIRTLAEWLPQLHAAWRPALSTVPDKAQTPLVPECWAEHPDMRRALSALYVAYQQAYKVKKRRPHHETDWYRALHERLGDITQLASAYRCHSASEDKPHMLLRGERQEAGAERVVQRMVLAQLHEAEAAGRTDDALALREEFDLDDETVRVFMAERFRAVLSAPTASQPVGRLESARLLADYQVVGADDLRWAQWLSTLMQDLEAIGHRGDDLSGLARQRLEPLLEVYGPLLRKYDAIRKVIPILVEQRAASEAGDEHQVRHLQQRIAAEIQGHDITDEDIQVVWEERRAARKKH